MTRIIQVWSLLTAVTVLSFSGLSAQSRIEGDLYLLSSSGEVKPGAANEVALIPRGPAVVEAWRAMCEDQEAESERVNSAIEGRDPREGLAMLLAMVGLQRDEKFELLRSLSTVRSGTGMAAHYEIEAPQGDYWLFATMPLGDVVHSWLHAVTLSGAAQRVDLDNGNVSTGGQLACDKPFPPN